MRTTPSASTSVSRSWRGAHATVLTLALCLLASASAVRPAAATPSGPTADLATDETIVLPPAASRMPSSWQRDFVVPYGDARAELGLGLEGDGDGILVGPNSGAQSPDGSWWFVDTHKFRIARYTADGSYLEDFPLEEQHLVGGVYFPHSGPRVLDDGTFLAVNLTMSGATTDLLRVRRGAMDVVQLPGEALFRTDDGRRLYGFTWEDGALVEADAGSRTLRHTDWFRTRAGHRFRITVADSALRVELPDASPPVDRRWSITDPAGDTVIASVEVASGTDGTLHLLLTGFRDEPGAPDLVGYTTISADGRLGAVEAVLSPYESTDPGGPSHLGVQPLGVRPWLVYLREDGVHVYRREPRPTPRVRGIDRACPTTTVPSSPFADVAAGGAHTTAIGCMAWWKVVQGTTATTFAPSAPVTRAQMASLLVAVVDAAGGEVPVDPPDRFTDDSGSVHESSIDQVAALGIVVGEGDRFRPSETVTRGQLATMVVRTVEHLSDRPLPGERDHFVDDDASVHEPAIARAAAAGLISGVAPERYAPAQTVSRAQTASLLARTMDLLVTEGTTALPS